MAVERKLGVRLVLVTEMLAAAVEELRRVTAELEEMTEGGRGDSGADQH